jgi:dTMP kinase
VTFIVLEGGEGSGKSTQTKKLGEHLRARGCVVRTTFEPGDTSRGKELRDRLLHGGALTADQELELMLEDRRLHVDEVIRPALARGEIVICDRFTPSSLAYQGVGRGLGVDAVAAASARATGGLEPDLVLVLDVPDAVAEARLAAYRDRFERAGDGFHEQVRRAYRELAGERGWVVIDGSGPPDEVFARLWAAVEPIL